MQLVQLHRESSSEVLIVQKISQTKKIICLSIFSCVVGFLYKILMKSKKSLKRCQHIGMFLTDRVHKRLKLQLIKIDDFVDLMSVDDLSISGNRIAVAICITLYVVHQNYIVLKL